jgi:hypothetical protein
VYLVATDGSVSQTESIRQKERISGSKTGFLVAIAREVGSIKHCLSAGLKNTNTIVADGW